MPVPKSSIVSLRCSSLLVLKLTLAQHRLYPRATLPPPSRDNVRQDVQSAPSKALCDDGVRHLPLQGRRRQRSDPENSIAS